MENVTMIQTEDVFGLIKSLEYGSVNVSFEDDTTKNFLQDCIDVLNIMSPGIAEMTQAVDVVPNDAGGWDENPIDGVYTVTYKSRDVSAPDLGPDDLTIEQHAKYCAENKASVEIHIHDGLIKYAKKQAFRAGVKLRIKDGKMMFDGREKSISIYKRMEAAYRDKADKIVFSLDEVSSETVRVYGSNLSVFTGQKIRVSRDAKNVTVHFTPVSQADLYKKELVAMFYKIVPQIGAEATQQIIKEAAELVLGESGQYEIPVPQIGAEATQQIEDADF